MEMPTPNALVRRDGCPGCGVLVLFVAVAGEVLLAEVGEITPAYPCPACDAVRSRGDRPGDCTMCGNVRRLGSRLPAEALVIDEVGRARLVRAGPARAAAGAGVRRKSGDAVHPFHACPLAMTG